MRGPNGGGLGPPRRFSEAKASPSRKSSPRGECPSALSGSAALWPGHCLRLTLVIPHSLRTVGVQIRSRGNGPSCPMALRARDSVAHGWCGIIFRAHVPLCQPVARVRIYLKQGAEKSRFPISDYSQDTPLWRWPGPSPGECRLR